MKHSVIFIRALLLAGLSSCVSLHTPTHHFTPCFTGRAQFEAEASLTTNNAAFNMAVSPTKRLAALGGVQYNIIKEKSNQFQSNIEFGLGYSRHLRHVLVGVNVLYGQGSYQWEYEIPTDSTAYDFFTSGSYKKGVLQPYILFTNNTSKPRWLFGFSCKQSFYFDDLKSVSDFGNNVVRSNSSTVFNPALEPCVFFRKSLLRVFYYNLQFGVIVGQDKTLVRREQLAFGRFGFGIKL